VLQFFLVEAAELLRCTERSIQRWHRSGKLPSFKLGANFTRFRRADVLAMLEPEPRLNFGAAQPR
jgi:excisionase family DNA binding protein